MKNAWTIVGIVLIVVLLLLLVGAAGMIGFGGLGARAMMGRAGGFGMMGGFHPLGWLVSCVVSLLVIGGIVWLVVWFARRAGTSPTTPTTPTALTSESPFDILKTRYAKGEITKEQYDVMKQDLA